jgi:hypothetical protein
MQSLMRDILTAQRAEALTRRFERRCVDLLFLGIFVGSLFVDVLCIQNGTFLNALKSCPPIVIPSIGMEKTWWGIIPIYTPVIRNVSKFITSTFCVSTIAVLSAVLAVGIVFGPLVYIALYRARDHIAARNASYVAILIHLFVPDIIHYPMSALGSLGISGGLTGRVLVGLLHGNWRTWLTVWLTWILLFMMAFMHAHQWGPAIMSSTWKHFVWCFTMAIVFPILSAGCFDGVDLVTYILFIKRMCSLEHITQAWNYIGRAVWKFTVLLVHDW